MQRRATFLPVVYPRAYSCQHTRVCVFSNVQMWKEARIDVTTSIEGVIDLIRPISTLRQQAAGAWKLEQVWQSYRHTLLHATINAPRDTDAKTQRYSPEFIRDYDATTDCTSLVP